MHVHDPPDPVPEESCNPASFTRRVSPPAELVQPGTEERLWSALRNTARQQDPLAALEAAAVTLYTAENPQPGRPSGTRATAQALADLAVTGRTVYGRFRAAPPSEEAVLAAARASLTRGRYTVVEPALLSAVRQVRKRAFQVAWAIRGPVGARRQRPMLGWIAVSSDDDPPHRPVNVESAPFPQHDLLLTVAGRRVVTRFFVASRNTPLEPLVDLNDPPLTPPPEPLPAIPPEDDVILFVHGHSSRAEEALPLVPHLLRLGEGRRQGVTVVALDLPSNGYATRVDPYDDGRFPMPCLWDNFPVLAFIEGCIEAFVEELARTTGMTNRFAAVIGGSLGGNMALRLAEREPGVLPWMRAAVPWSPASVWASFDRARGDKVRETALFAASERSKEEESDGHRATHFFQVFDESVWPFSSPQSNYWYRGDWPCKEAAVQGARNDRRELYGREFRRWHWRVGLEQLVFSHVEVTREGGPPRFELARTRTLLLAGEEDNHQPVAIYDASREMAWRMTGTPGYATFLRRTGHSMHLERPALMARLISDFVWEQPVEVPGRSARKLDFVIRTGADGIRENSEAFAAVCLANGQRFEVPLNQRAAWAPISLNTRSIDLPAGTTVADLASVEIRFVPGKKYFFDPEDCWDVHSLLIIGPEEPRAVHLSQQGIGRLSPERLVVTFPFGRPRIVGAHPLDATLRLASRSTRLVPTASGVSDAAAGVPGEAFRLTPEPGGRCTIRTSGGRYLGVRVDGTVVADRDQQTAARFRVRPLGSSRVAIEGPSGSFLGHDGRVLRVGPTRVGATESFALERTDVPPEWPLGVAPTDPPAVVGNGDLLELVVRGADGAIWHRTVRPDDTASAWTSLGGVATSGPTLARRRPGVLDVFVRGTDHALHHATNEGGRWHWAPSPSGVLTSAPSACSASDGTVHVFCRGDDGQLHQRTLAGEAWGGWTPVGGVLTSAPAAVSRGFGRLDVFMRGTDRALYHARQAGGGPWEWECLGGTLTSAPGAAARGEDDLEVVVLGTDARPYRRTWRGNERTEWDDSLGGWLISAPALAVRGTVVDLVGMGTDRGLYRHTSDGRGWRRFCLDSV